MIHSSLTVYLLTFPLSSRSDRQWKVHLQSGFFQLWLPNLRNDRRPSSVSSTQRESQEGRSGSTGSWVAGVLLIQIYWRGQVDLPAAPEEAAKRQAGLLSRSLRSDPSQMWVEKTIAAAFPFHLFISLNSLLSWKSFPKLWNLFVIQAISKTFFY